MGFKIKSARFLLLALQPLLIEEKAQEVLSAGIQVQEREIQEEYNKQTGVANSKYCATVIVVTLMLTIMLTVINIDIIAGSLSLH